MNDRDALLKSKMDDASYAKLTALHNEHVNDFVAYAIRLCEPAKVFVGDDSDSDEAYCRMRAIDTAEELQLNTNGHTVHYDGYFDQARKKEVTKYLVPAGVELDKNLNQMEREAGIKELEELQGGAYRGREVFVRFFCLGTTNSVFAIPCLQITDSSYVVHSEQILYRRGYEEFRRQSAANADFEFFKYLHCSGELDERNTSKNYELNRVYMDYTQNCVRSVNTQYAGNTVGLKKLSLRLAIRKADAEGWLAEHMFIMRVNGPNGRKTYVAGAYPSACGKTSTAMIPGENIVGDDLAYFRVIDGEFRAVNVEAGIFGIITDVNAEDDPVIYKVLTSPGEVIFSNTLMKDGKSYWEGMGQEIPSEGTNHASANWTEGMLGPDGKPTTCSHKNARYTIKIEDLANKDPEWDKAEGLPMGGIIYGGRDSDTNAPVREAYSWEHGVCTMGAMLESETTSATIGKEGVRTWNVMSNMDFLSMSVGRYIQNNLDFAKEIERPKVFGTNYFLKKDGKYCNGKLDKSVWVKWMELRIHGEAEAIDAGYGLIPKYEDLARLFRQVLDKPYSKEDYAFQFRVNIPELLGKLGRMEEIFSTKVTDTPATMKAEMKAQRERLEALRAAKGDYVSPFDLA